MAFTWSAVFEAAGEGNKVTKSSLQELRDNTDWIKNNPPCTSFNSVVYSNVDSAIWNSQLVSVLGANYVPYYAGVNSAVDGAQNVSADATQYAGANVPHDDSRAWTKDLTV